MAADPIATYDAWIIAKDGLRISGDARSGIKATVKYLVKWKDAYAFLNAVVTPIYATRVGSVTYSLPYRLPSNVVATPVYAQSFDVQPCGLDANMTPTTPLPTRGMAAGEFYSHAVVTIGFEQLTYAFDASDDSSSMNQLDPANPIVLCEQSVKIAGKMVTRKGLQFQFTDDNKAVVGDVAVPVVEADLTLKFPHVSFLPWQLLVPYVNTVNASAIFGCAAETLLMKSPDTHAKQSMGFGSNPTSIEQAVTLTLGYNPIGWNKLPKPDGTYQSVKLKGDPSRGIFAKSDFSSLFTQISFSQGT